MNGPNGDVTVDHDADTGAAGERTAVPLMGTTDLLDAVTARHVEAFCTGAEDSECFRQPSNALTTTGRLCLKARKASSPG